MKNFLNKNKGFTLLEVLFASFIIFIFLGGIFYLLRGSIFGLTSMKNRFVALYLAQEGIEIVKNIRDTNFLQNTSWVSGIGTGERQGDYLSASLSDYTGAYLRQDASGFFQYSSGSPTKFKRKITINQIDANRIRVVVEVIWEEKGIQKNFIIFEEITKWL